MKRGIRVRHARAAIGCVGLALPAVAQARFPKQYSEQLEAELAAVRADAQAEISSAAQLEATARANGWRPTKPPRQLATPPLWLEHCVKLPVGPLFCIIDGPTAGRAWLATAVRAEMRRLAAEAGVRRRFAPHQLRHAHAVELAREGVRINIIQRQLGHTDLGTTSTALDINTTKSISSVRSPAGLEMCRR